MSQSGWFGACATRRTIAVARTRRDRRPLAGRHGRTGV